MTNTFKNSRLTNFVCWMISFIVIGFNVYLFINYLQELHWPLYAVVFSIIYFSFVLYLICIPLETFETKESGLDSEEETGQ
jgi:hypothetical protein